ncbi:williams-beuren syndrome critical region protein, putative [Schistosoma mansoni]|uniref:williams-beuren syndrome critical region protein, putative n=1 Tax=Schistosoma mansoni TaxID=6183 RepID=UPI00022C8786|nr:williams-beuren syndrome critical region protein, putative [Schistosoma mansoni]|eukprot:XP_018646624.1 williams-beuren syndrome critical region protein, putative [Schistosoma mansoni]
METIPITNEEGLLKRPNRKLIQYLKRKEQQSSCIVHDVNNDTCVTTKNDSIPMNNTLTSHKSECYKRLKMSDSLCQTKVVIDCSYDHLMSFKDICKLANQVANCYSFNRRAKYPVQLYITGLGSRNTIETNINDKDISTNDNLLSVDKCKSIRLYDRLKLCNCDSWDVNLCESFIVLNINDVFPSLVLSLITVVDRYVDC